MSVDKTNSSLSKITASLQQAIETASFHILFQHPDKTSPITSSTLQSQVAKFIVTQLRKLGCPDIVCNNRENNNKRRHSGDDLVSDEEDGSEDEQQLMDEEDEDAEPTSTKRKAGIFLFFQRWAKDALEYIRTTHLQDRQYYCIKTNNNPKDKKGATKQRKRIYIEYFKAVSIVTDTMNPIEAQYHVNQIEKLKAEHKDLKTMTLEQLVSQTHNNKPLILRIITSIKKSVVNCLDGLIWFYCRQNQHFYEAFNETTKLHALKEFELRVSTEYLTKLFLQEETDINQIFEPYTATPMSKPRLYFDEEYKREFSSNEPTQKEKLHIKDWISQYMTSFPEIEQELTRLTRHDSSQTDDNEYITVDIDSMKVQTFRKLQHFCKIFSHRIKHGKVKPTVQKQRPTHMPTQAHIHHDDTSDDSSEFSSDDEEEDDSVHGILSNPANLFCEPDF